MMGQIVLLLFRFLILDRFITHLIISEHFVYKLWWCVDFYPFLLFAQAPHCIRKYISSSQYITRRLLYDFYMIFILFQHLQHTLFAFLVLILYSHISHIVLFLL